MSDRTIYYDQPHDRLVYVEGPADQDYWDAHWNKMFALMARQPDHFVLGTTKKYLPKGAKVVDAGCGTARTVFGLHRAGYEAYGVDLAPQTVARVKELMPELNIAVADVRNMSMFSDGFFDGVWSLGVIEHFYDGYEDIVEETHRLLRLGGYAFVTVPAMSPLRRRKARVGGYPRWDARHKERFYQFALTPKSVVENWERAGFRLISSKGRGGFSGVKDELPLLRPLLQKFYDSEIKPLRLARAFLDRMLNPITYHSRLYVFVKEAS